MIFEGGPYYVIVGVGFSAVLNHLLLKSTGEGGARLAGLEVLHIGSTDPWNGYSVETMGQWPALLTLPEFANQHRGENARGFLTCRAFARATAAELAKLTGAGRVIPGWVTGVERLAGGGFLVHYREGGETKILPAAKIDFCSGWGPAHTLPKSQVDSHFHASYIDGTESSQPPRLLSATAYLANGQAGKEIASVGVYGDGGTAAWCVEKALASPETKEVVWFSRRPFRNSTIPRSGRNDALFSDFERSRDNNGPLLRVTPHDQRLQMAWGYEILQVERGAGESVRAEVREFAAADRNYIGHLGSSLGDFSSRSFDRLVIAIGQTYQSGLRNQLKQIVQYPILVDGPDKLLAGFADREEHAQANVRILGPAAFSPEFREISSESYLDLQSFYVETLPAQADGGLISSSAALIGKSDGYFHSGRPNRNINTASLWDLTQLGMEKDAAVAFLTKRRVQTDPVLQIAPGLERLSLDYQP